MGTRAGFRSCNGACEGKWWAPRRQIVCVLLFAVGGLAVCALTVAADPIPPNYTDVAEGSSHFDGHLNQSDSAWFRVSGNDTHDWWVSVNSSGAGGQISFFYSDDDQVNIWAIPANSPIFGMPGYVAAERKQPFYNATPYFLKLVVWQSAPNASQGLDYSMDVGIEPVPALTDQVGELVNITRRPGGEVSRPLFRISAAAGDDIVVEAAMGTATEAPAAGPAVLVNIFTSLPLYGRYDDFPAGWDKGLWGGNRGEFWAAQALNVTACQGFTCSTLARFVAPANGTYFVTVRAGVNPTTASVTLVLRSRVSAAFPDSNNAVPEAENLYHKPNVAGNLSWGVDPFDWFTIDLRAGDAVSFGLTLVDPAVYTTSKPGVYSAGTLQFLYEITLLAPNSTRVLAGVTNEVPGEIGGRTWATLTVPSAAVTAAGTYLLKLTVLTCGETSYPNFSPSNYATYNISVLQPNAAPSFVGPTPAAEAPEDTQAIVDLGPLFADPEADPLAFSVVAAPPGTRAFSQPANGTWTLTVTPLPNFNGNMTVVVRVTDWFGASATGDLVLLFDPVNDAPFLNGTIPLSFLTWPQGGSTTNLSFATFFADPDADALTLTLSLPPEITSATCGLLCASFSSPDPEFFGNGTVVVAAVDPDGLNTSAAFAFVVFHVNRPPLALGPPAPSVTVTAGAAGALLPSSVACTDPDGDPVILGFDASDAPLQSVLGLTLANASGGADLLFSASLEGDAGTWTATIRCSDPLGLSIQASASVVVLRPPHPPLLSSASPAAAPQVVVVSEGEAVRFAATIYDPDGDRIAYAWSYDGAAIGGANASELSLAMDFESAGSHVLRLHATDPGGLSLEVAWELRVLNVDRAPVCGIQTEGLLEGAVGDTVNLRSASVDEDNDSLAFEWRANGTLSSTELNMSFERRVGTTVLELRVFDGELESTCSIEARGIQSAAPENGNGSPSNDGLLTLLFVAIPIGGAAAVAGWVAWRRGRGRGPR